jgi:hypothetical protein
MIDNDSVTVLKFENILDQRLGIYWEGNEYYPATVLKKEESHIKDIYCIRYAFDGSTETQSNECLNKLKEIVFGDGLEKHYQVCIGHSAEIASRIRSYKGIITKRGIEGTYIETEVPFENRTVIAAIIDLSEYNYDQNISKLWDSSTSFILSSKRKYFSSPFITKIIDDYRKSGVHTSLNYLELVLDFCNQGDVIYKTGGYASDEFPTFDTFHSKQYFHD